MARPEKPIDWAKVDQLLLAGCSGTEICPHFDMTPDTFYIRVKEKYNLGFQEYCSIKRQQGESLLRVKQFENALKGNSTMLIWLGKQRLGQKENDTAFNKIPLDYQQSIQILLDQLSEAQGKIAELNKALINSKTDMTS